MENKGKFIVATDSGCDLSKEICEGLMVYTIGFDYSSGEEIYHDNMEPEEYKIFYNEMRKGKNYKTSQINMDKYYEFFKDLAKYNLPIIFISLTLGVSNTLNNALMAKEELEKEIPNFDLRVIDSKIASLGIGLLVNKACKLRDEGKDINETEKVILETVPKMGVFYTTNTLTYFARGGRISKTSCLIGSVLGINVIMDCNPQGNLRTLQKCHGRNKAKKIIINRVKETIVDPSNQVLYICHSDCYDEAVLFATELVNEVGFDHYYLTDMGPIIGTHTGPGLITIFYEGIERK